jgi:MtN3 and saliva related transmembrane protein
MDGTTILGMLAAVCTTGAFVPGGEDDQNPRHAKHINSHVRPFFSVGTICWLIYGVQLRNLPVIAANAITSVLALTILTYKTRERPRK